MYRNGGRVSFIITVRSWKFFKNDDLKIVYHKLKNTEGRNGFFTNEVLQFIGDKYGKSVAQTVLRFLIQRGVVVILKSTHVERMKENSGVFDFILIEEDMNRIAILDTGKSLFLFHNEPSTVDFFVNISK